MPPKHTITCMGVSPGNFHTIYFGPNYNFPTDYPWGNHSKRIMDPTKTLLGYFKPTWSVAIVPTSGEKVTGIFNIRDCSVSFAVDSMDQILITASDQRICTSCHYLLFHLLLLKILKSSSSKHYPKRLYNTFCPLSEVLRRNNHAIGNYNNLRLESFNQTRKIGTLEKRCGKKHPFVKAVARLQVPNLGRMLANHVN